MESISFKINHDFFQIINGLKQLESQIKQVLKLDQKVLELAKELYNQKSLLIMGRGYNFATCLEGALVILTFQ